MTEKRYINRLNRDNIKFRTLNPVWDNEICDALNVFEMINLLNEQDEKIKHYKAKASSWKITASEQILEQSNLMKENEQLKKALLDIEEDRDYYKSKASSIEEGYIQLQDKEIRLTKENEQLKFKNDELKFENTELKMRKLIWR